MLGQPDLGSCIHPSPSYQVPERRWKRGCLRGLPSGWPEETLSPSLHVHPMCLPPTGHLARGSAANGPMHGAHSPRGAPSATQANARWRDGGGAVESAGPAGAQGWALSQALVACLFVYTVWSLCHLTAPHLPCQPLVHRLCPPSTRAPPAPL